LPARRGADLESGGTSASSERRRGALGRPRLTRRAVLAAASGATLLASLGGCAAPPETAAPAPPDAPRAAPSQALYRQQLIVQRAEPTGTTRIAAADWRLKVGGLVGKPLELAYDDLARFPRTAQTSALHCVEGWSVADLRWEGIRLAALLEAVEPLAAAAWVTFDTFPGVYRESLSLEQARLADVLLAYRLGDAPLTDDLGFPLRLVVPRMYGYKSVKWVDRITLSDKREAGYWVARGYPADAWLS
jgi:DMSO/TMAO reductase YedYZ molybdopterin-dependent catalytic subunit